jgi:MoaE-MoaD fusion protein
MISISVLFFANLKEVSGVSQARIDLREDSSVEQLKGVLSEKFPALKPYMKSALVSINQEFAFEKDIFQDGAEVAFFPPVSGGSSETPTVIRLVSEPINLDQLGSQITNETTGAACVFTGFVRGITTRSDPHETISLEYEAYAPMAEAKMAQIALEIRRKWPVIEGIALIQRVGVLSPGTPTVAVACSAAHRDTGIFEAAHYGIDRLKEIVPVWKKEIGPHRQEWVEGTYRPGKGD